MAIKPLEFLNQFLADVEKKTPEDVFDVFGWEFTFKVPSGLAQEQAVKKSANLEGFDFLSSYKKWLISFCIKSIKSPLGDVLIYDPMMVIDPVGGVGDYFFSHVNKLPFPVLSAFYKKVNILKDKFVLENGLPVDRGMLKLEEDSPEIKVDALPSSEEGSKKTGV